MCMLNMKANNTSQSIAPTASIASNAMIVGDVTIGENVCVMHGAQIIAESAPIKIGDNCIILENAVLRGTKDFPLEIGRNCLVGPNAHLAGCIIKDNVFLATGVSVFHGAQIETNSEVRINGVVHVNSILKENTTVPIAWVAVGNPAQLFAPHQHQEIWAVQQKMEFNKTVYGIDKSGNDMPQICKEMGVRLREHFNQKIT